MGVFQKMPYRPMYLVLLLFMFVFPILYCHREQTLRMASDAFVDGDEITVCGTLYKKEIKNDSVYLYVKNLSVSNQSIPGRMILISDTDEIPYHSNLKTTVRVKAFSVAENDGSFDEKKYYFSQGIIMRGEICGEVMYQPSIRSGFFEILNHVKNSMSRCFEAFFPGEESGLMKAMCLGDKTELDVEAKSLFQDAGLSHILAVSGLHISIVGMGLFRALKRWKIGFYPAAVISVVAVVLYGFVVGYSLSALRAVLMFLIYMGSIFLGGAYDLCSSWILAFVIVLMMEPVSILNSAFVFSFGAVFGIFAVARPLAGGFEKKKSFQAKITTALLFSIGIQLFTLPIVAYFSYTIPVYVIGLNIVLIPLLSFVIGCGLIGGILETLHLFGKPLLYVCHLILYLYEWASDASLQLPVARITVGRPSVIRIMIYYLLLLLFLRWFEKKENLRHVIKTAAVIFVLFILLLGWHPNPRMSVSMLSVGQGDGICVTSKEGFVYMIDGGSSSKKNMGKFILKPFLSYHGISKVDYWLVSHLDSDHISGLMELLEDGYRIDHVVFTESVKRSEEDTAKEHYQTILDLCEKNGTEILYVDTGDTFGTKSLNFLCLSPDENEYSGTNENSMVLKMSYGEFDMLFTGDIGSEQEKDILNESTDVLTDVEVLKSAHHGSKNSNCDEWLTKISPTLTLFSAGKNNRYGHPSKETIERMEENDLSYICTIDSGQITIKPKENGRFSIYTYNSR